MSQEIGRGAYGLPRRPMHAGRAYDSRRPPRGTNPAWPLRLVVAALVGGLMLRGRWTDREPDAARFDVQDGILLARVLHATFGFLRIGDDAIVVSAMPDGDAHAVPTRVRDLAGGRRGHLPRHRRRLFDAPVNSAATHAPWGYDCPEALR
jgi:hypothetical protein